MPIGSIMFYKRPACKNDGTSIERDTQKDGDAKKHTKRFAVWTKSSPGDRAKGHQHHATPHGPIIDAWDERDTNQHNDGNLHRGIRTCNRIIIPCVRVGCGGLGQADCEIAD